MTGEGKRGRTGRLKVFLGYAAGVGKTYQMLEEGRDRLREGVDVVLGYFEPHGRRDTIARAAGLEQIQRRRVDYRGTTFEEMDVAAILARRPTLCLVDELAHTNVPGSPCEKRWEDVRQLLDAGLDVYTTMNIQHLESLNDQVYQFTGVRVRETVPDWVIRQADEVVMIDLTPAALRNRLARGVVYAQEKASQALEQFFREPSLAALRELALRQTAREVDARSAALPAAGPGQAGEPDAAAQVASEKVLMLVTEDPASVGVIRRGRRVADYLKAECLAVAVCPRGELAALPRLERDALERHLAFARDLRIETRVLAGNEPARVITAFARSQGVSQIFVARPRPTRLPFGLGGRDVVLRLIEQAKEFQVMVVARRGPAAARPVPFRPR
jgi:two-component system, OmpR family, sensor histidine kinase KdpD